MSSSIPLLIESLVSVLLICTIVYCWRLNQRLAVLRKNESLLKDTIAELVTATEVAERAIINLKNAVRESDATLMERLKRAEILSLDMSDQLRIGEDILKRITRIAEAAQPGKGSLAPTSGTRPGVLDASPVDEAPRPSKAASTAAAAQALVRRTRERRTEVAA